MLYLGMDVHAKQVTIAILNEQGRELSMRQVTTRPQGFDAFLSRTAELAATDGGYAAMLEVCGFHDWIVDKLGVFGCKRIVVTQSTQRCRQKTDRRDARQLAELLWVNRQRLLEGKRPKGLRIVEPPSERDAQARRLTMARIRTVRKRTATVNAMKRIVRRRNFQHDCPTESITTRAAIKWLRELELDAVDKCEMATLIDQLQVFDVAIAAFDDQMRRMEPLFPELKMLRTIPGVALFVGMTIACRIGTLERFPRGCSLANFWGLAPGIDDSGDRQGNIGAITKRGSAAVRYALGQTVVHVLRTCPPLRNWSRGIRRRRGKNKARVALMRRLATIIHRMMQSGETFESMVAGMQAVQPC